MCGTLPVRRQTDMEQTKPNGHGMPTDSGAQLADAGIDQLTERAGRICLRR
jgi:hypothetical protein